MNGEYRVQFIHAEHLAAQGIEAGSWKEGFAADADGPETFTFEEPLRLLASAVGYALTQPVRLLRPDVFLARVGVDGIMAGLPTSDAVPAGKSTLGGWFTHKWGGFRQRYVAELRRSLGP